MDIRDNNKFIEDVGTLLFDYDLLTEDIKEYLNNCYADNKVVDVEYLDTLVAKAISEEVK
ncbi:hypothetical protein [Staphylococcus epidermidis]|uniref:hypothetical protein n=1 Tax=Staphylococcus epidermidis TaxID=1282 RepID=UPI0011A07981|nr:hypothetical protein [Staphylococcus epidermidis]HDF4459015.1 hypothetical protein [Staphylococcus aureus]